MIHYNMAYMDTETLAKEINNFKNINNFYPYIIMSELTYNALYQYSLVNHIDVGRTGANTIKKYKECKVIYDNDLVFGEIKIGC